MCFYSDSTIYSHKSVQKLFDNLHIIFSNSLMGFKVIIIIIMTLFIEEAQLDVYPIFPGVLCESCIQSFTSNIINIYRNSN